jgi:ABC-type branched-subunit amino acid transport system ATPase component
MSRYRRSTWALAVGIDANAPALEVSALNVHLQRAHVLQGVDLVLQRGVLGVIGRNGMGKSTLCRALMGMLRSTGSVRSFGQQLAGLDTSAIARRSVAYVPQARRLWPALTVHEHLRLMAARGGQRWTAQRVYERFPQLRSRQSSEASKLSGGEQQMLSIARALMAEPALLILDEPTEGLAPVVVDDVVELLRGLVRDEGMSLLLVEQNLGVAIELSESIAVLTNGLISQTVSAASLRGDVQRQRELLGFASA